MWSIYQKHICRILPLSHDIPVYLLTQWNTNQMFTILNRCVYFHNISLVPKIVPSKCPFFKDIMSPSAILSVRRETNVQHITWTFQMRDLAYRISSLILPGNKYEIFFLLFFWVLSNNSSIIYLYFHAWYWVKRSLNFNMMYSPVNDILQIG